MKHLADPKRPYKMYAAILVAFLTEFATAPFLPLWASALITSLIAGLAVYLKSNPTVGGTKENVLGNPETEDTLF